MNFNFNCMQDVRLAKQFEGLVKLDNRFELVQEATMGLVCFRLKVNGFRLITVRCTVAKEASPLSSSFKNAKLVGMLKHVKLVEIIMK